MNTDLVLDVSYQRLELLFERPTHPGASHYGREVDREDPFVVQRLYLTPVSEKDRRRNTYTYLRYLFRYNPACKALEDRGLANTGWPNELVLHCKWDSVRSFVCFVLTTGLDFVRRERTKLSVSSV